MNEMDRYKLSSSPSPPPPPPSPNDNNAVTTMKLSLSILAEFNASNLQNRADKHWRNTEEGGRVNASVN